MEVSELKTRDAIRRDRIFKQKKSWFFATREGINMGPFPDQSSAELEMINYARSMKARYRHVSGG